jgi:NifU-like protein
VGPCEVLPSIVLDEAYFKKTQIKDYLGSFDPSDAEAKQMRIVTGAEKSEQHDEIRLHLLVDIEDGVIADVRFQVFGKCVYYLVLEAVAELILLKSYPQAMKVSSQLIESKLKKDKLGLPSKLFDQAINLSLFALDEALRNCTDIPVDEKELITPIENDDSRQEIPNWMGLDLKTQLEILEKVISEDIRPYIELDEGGIEIVSLKESIFLTIGYKGACTTCHSSTGSTLNAIQQILRNKVFPALVVIPDSSWISRDHD